MLMLYLHGHFIRPDEVVRGIGFFSDFPFCPYSFRASMISIGIFSVAAPILSLIIYLQFQKTPSTEILFFSGIIISIACESCRGLIPAFGLWKSYSDVLMFLGRLQVFARMLSFFSIFFSVVFGEADERENETRNLMILLISAIAISMVFPVNTSLLGANCSVAMGFSRMSANVRLAIFFVTLLCMWIQGKTRELPYTWIKIGSLVLMFIGYNFLCVADCFLFLISGTILFFAGTWFYLRTIHNIENSIR